jgi:hypothetical protein
VVVDGGDGGATIVVGGTGSRGGGGDVGGGGDGDGGGGGGGGGGGRYLCSDEGRNLMRPANEDRAPELSNLHLDVSPCAPTALRAFVELTQPRGHNVANARHKYRVGIERPKREFCVVRVRKYERGSDGQQSTSVQPQRMIGEYDMACEDNTRAVLPPPPPPHTHTHTHTHTRTHAHPHPHPPHQYSDFELTPSRREIKCISNWIILFFMEK